MALIKLATMWLGGCSGCHMSFLDLDEWLLELATKVEVVYSPFADIKEYPEHVDVALIEGAVANEDNLHLLKLARRNTQTLIAFGDCAITGNVTALRNILGAPKDILQRIYVDGVERQGQLPTEEGIVPILLDRVVPIQAVVPVEVYLPGCPPSAERIRAALEHVLAGNKTPFEGREMLKFG